jgi:hypothetical protein
MWFIDALFTGSQIQHLILNSERKNEKGVWAY